VIGLLRSTGTRAALSVAILWWLSTRLDMAEALRATAAVSLPHLALVLALVAVDRAVMVYRWWLLLTASGVPVSARQATRIFLISSFVGSFLPAGVGGDAARTYGLRQHTGNGGEALASVLVDRVLGMVSLGTMALAGLLAWRAGQGVSSLVVGGAVALIVGSLTLFWLDRAVHHLWADRAHATRFGRAVVRVADALSRYRDRPSALAAVLVWSVGVQMLRISEAYILGLGLGLTVPLSAYLLFMPIGLLMLLLPVSVSGFGLPQGVFVWMLRPLGVPDATSFALSTLIVLTGLAGNLPGLVLWLRRERESL
jgi:uncharacterized protein (TIRG00374 family)